MEAGKRVSKWNREAKTRFIEGLVEHGSAKAAFAALNVPSASAYRHRRDDPVFAKQWAWAQQINNEALWDDEMHAQRAVDGAPPSERMRAVLLGIVGRQMISEHARWAALPAEDAERATLRRARMSLDALARSLGFEL